MHDAIKNEMKLASSGAKPVQTVMRKPHSASVDTKPTSQPIENKEVEKTAPVSSQIHEPPKPKINEPADVPAPAKVPTSSTKPEVSQPKFVEPEKVKVEAAPPPVADVRPAAVIEDMKNGSEVKLVYAGSHYSAYIRPADSDAEYFELLQRVSDAAPTAKKLSELPKRNDVINAPFLGDYYRALVLKAESIDQPIRVAFLDFGNVDNVKFDDARELDEELKNAKRFTLRILLDGLDRDVPNPKGFELLKIIETDESESFIVHDVSNNATLGKDAVVKLVNTKTKECLNDKLMATAEKPAGTAGAAPARQAPVEEKTAPVSAPAPAPSPVLAPAPVPKPVKEVSWDCGIDREWIIRRLHSVFVFVSGEQIR